jgi:hypothetical protein
MAAPKGILALIAGKPKESADSLPGESAGSGSSDPTAEALKNMWSNMKAGDFEAAAMDFHEAYDHCSGAHEEDSEPSDEGETSDEEM